jgi:hypothetical protein
MSTQQSGYHKAHQRPYHNVNGDGSAAYAYPEHRSNANYPHHRAPGAPQQPVHHGGVKAKRTPNRFPPMTSTTLPRPDVAAATTAAASHTRQPSIDRIIRPLGSRMPYDAPRDSLEFAVTTPASYSAQGGPARKSTNAPGRNPAQAQALTSKPNPQPQPQPQSRSQSQPKTAPILIDLTETSDSDTYTPPPPSRTADNLPRHHASANNHAIARGMDRAQHHPSSILPPILNGPRKPPLPIPSPSYTLTGPTSVYDARATDRNGTNHHRDRDSPNSGSLLAKFGYTGGNHDRPNGNAIVVEEASATLIRNETRHQPVQKESRSSPFVRSSAIIPSIENLTNDIPPTRPSPPISLPEVIETDIRSFRGVEKRGPTQIIDEVGRTKKSRAEDVRNSAEQARTTPTIESLLEQRDVVADARSLSLEEKRLLLLVEEPAGAHHMAARHPDSIEKEPTPQNLKIDVAPPRRIDRETISPGVVNTELTSPRIVSKEAVPKGVDEEAVPPRETGRETVSPRRFNIEVVPSRSTDRETMPPGTVDKDVPSKSIDRETVSPRRVNKEDEPPRRIDSETASPRKVDKQVVSSRRVNKDVVASRRVSEDVVPRPVDKVVIPQAPADKRVVSPRIQDKEARVSMALETEVRPRSSTQETRPRSSTQETRPRDSVEEPQPQAAIRRPGSRGNTKGKPQTSIEREASAMFDPGRIAQLVAEHDSADQRSALLDAQIYRQDGARSPPPGVSLDQEDTGLFSAKYSPVYLHVNPRIHGTHFRTEEWYQKKAEEIRQRGGRKRCFGKPKQRRKWLQAYKAEAERALAQKEKLISVPLPRDPEPWGHQRPADFASMREEDLPSDVKENPAWLRICARMREDKAMRHRAASKEEFSRKQEADAKRKEEVDAALELARHQKKQAARKQAQSELLEQIRKVSSPRSKASVQCRPS